MSASSPNPAGARAADATALAAPADASTHDATGNASGDASAHAGRAPHPHGKMLHPVVMMLWVLAVAIALT